MVEFGIIVLGISLLALSAEGQTQTLLDDGLKPSICTLPSKKSETRAFFVQDTATTSEQRANVFLTVLGIAQDGGFPQTGCRKQCCRSVWSDASLRRYVSSVAIVDRISGERWIFDCSPDFRDQLQLLDTRCTEQGIKLDGTIGLSGIFLTHAHMGHYTGLMHLGREAVGSAAVPVYGMPRMNQFLKTNGPWSQLVKLKNIELRQLENDKTIKLNDRIRVTPFRVPHRDEFSETVGFRIETASRSVIYLPDIDKWSRWNRSIEKLVEQVDIAYLDGTFFENGEIPGRDMKTIPHPFVQESIARFATLDVAKRNRVRFIHLNHTNPAIRLDSPARHTIRRAGMHVAVQGEIVEL